MYKSNIPALKDAVKEWGDRARNPEGVHADIITNVLCNEDIFEKHGY